MLSFVDPGNHLSTSSIHALWTRIVWAVGQSVLNSNPEGPQVRIIDDRCSNSALSKNPDLMRMLANSLFGLKDRLRREIIRTHKQYLINSTMRIRLTNLMSFSTCRWIMKPKRSLNVVSASACGVVGWLGSTLAWRLSRELTRSNYLMGVRWQIYCSSSSSRISSRSSTPVLGSDVVWLESLIALSCAQVVNRLVFFNQVHEKFKWQCLYEA